MANVAMTKLTGLKDVRRPVRPVETPAYLLRKELMVVSLEVDISTSPALYCPTMGSKDVGGNIKLRLAKLF